MNFRERHQWLNEQFGVDGLAQSLEHAHEQILEAEQEASRQQELLRSLEEELEQAEAEVSFLTLADETLKNDRQRKAALDKALLDDPTCQSLRREVRAHKRYLEDARAAAGVVSDRQKNLRALAELRAAQMKLLAR